MTVQIPIKSLINFIRPNVQLVLSYQKPMLLTTGCVDELAHKNTVLVKQFCFD